MPYIPINHIAANPFEIQWQFCQLTFKELVLSRIASPSEIRVWTNQFNWFRLAYYPQPANVLQGCICSKWFWQEGEQKKIIFNDDRGLGKTCLEDEYSESLLHLVTLQVHFCVRRTWPQDCNLLILLLWFVGKAALNGLSILLHVQHFKWALWYGSVSDMLCFLGRLTYDSWSMETVFILHLCEHFNQWWWWGR